MLDAALSPLTWLLLAALGAIFLRRAWRTLAIALLLVAIAIVTPFGANFLVYLVEMRPAELSTCASQSGDSIVVLGAGLEHKPRDATDISALSATSMRRLFAAVDLVEADPDAHLYVVGASDFRVPESVISAHLAERLGVRPASLSTENHSRTTWENAQNLRALLPTPPPRLRLVTSALHLRRATLAFHVAGFEVCPIASDSDYLAPGPTLEYYLPRTSALRKADAAIHELIGQLVYQWRARKIDRARTVSVADRR